MRFLWTNGIAARISATIKNNSMIIATPYANVWMTSTRLLSLSSEKKAYLNRRHNEKYT
jgi:hypothetical protein